MRSARKDVFYNPFGKLLIIFGSQREPNPDRMAGGGSHMTWRFLKKFLKWSEELMVFKKQWVSNPHWKEASEVTWPYQEIPNEKCRRKKYFEEVGITQTLPSPKSGLIWYILQLTMTGYFIVLEDNGYVFTFFFNLEIVLKSRFYLFSSWRIWNTHLIKCSFPIFLFDLFLGGIVYL